MDEITILLLAAGNSSRMGHPKQLLPWGKHTLIQHQIENLLQTGNALAVVLGANANLITPVIRKYEADVFINPNWENGMGSSIAYGIKQLTRKFPGAEGVMTALIDQPLVPVSHYQSLSAQFRHGERQIVASLSDKGWLGVPAIFDKIYFDKLLELDGESGAKTIIRKHASQVIPVSCDDFLEDLDTPESYRRMLERFNKNA